MNEMVKLVMNDNETNDETEEKEPSIMKSKSEIKSRYMEPARRSALVSDVHRNFLRKGDGVRLGRALSSESLTMLGSSPNKHEILRTEHDIIFGVSESFPKNLKDMLN